MLHIGTVATLCVRVVVSVGTISCNILRIHCSQRLIIQEIPGLSRKRFQRNPYYLHFRPIETTTKGKQLMNNSKVWQRMIDNNKERGSLIRRTGVLNTIKIRTFKLSISYIKL